MKKLFLILVVLMVSLGSYEQGVVVRQEDSKGKVRASTRTTRNTSKKPLNKKRAHKKRSHKQKAFPAPQNEIKKTGHHTNMDNNQQR